MLRFTVNYDRFRNLRAIFGQRFTVAYVMADDNSGFFAVGTAQNENFVFVHLADTLPSTFLADFPGAIRVNAIDY